MLAILPKRVHTFLHFQIIHLLYTLTQHLKYQIMFYILVNNYGRSVTLRKVLHFQFTLGVFAHDGLFVHFTLYI